MLSDYLYQVWSKIENSNKVISIKNICNRLSLTNRVPVSLYLTDVTNYFKSLENAMFINDNQIIDKRTLINRKIDGPETLKEILNCEYFIFDFDTEKIYSELVDCIDVRPNAEVERVYISYPENLFSDFYCSTYIWEQSIETNKYGQPLLILNYLNRVGKPIDIFGIYANLAGALIDMSLEDLQRILKGYDNFLHIGRGYWVPKYNNDISLRLFTNQWLYRKICNEPLDELVNRYIVNKGIDGQQLCIEKMIESLKISGLNVKRESVEDCLIDKSYTEAYPGYWIKYENELSLGRFSLKALCDKTCSDFIKGIKNPRDVHVFRRRILQGETLEEVGEHMNVTRERVRQLEKKMRNKMYHVANCSYINHFKNWFLNILTKEKIVDLLDLGIRKEELEVFEIIMNRYFKSNKIQLITDSIVMLKAEYNRLLNVLKNYSQQNRIIYLSEIPFHSGVCNKLDLYKVFLNKCVGMIEINKKEFYYSGGNLTKEDELYLIIYKAGRPLHYTEISKAAKRFGMALSVNLGRNILSTMQRSNLLIRVAPGTYGLKEWDIPKHMYIKDLIYKILEDADRPMFYDEILAEVKRHRLDDIKDYSVLCYLSYNEDIKQIYTKQYILSEWMETPEKLIKHEINIEKIEDRSLLYRNKVILEVIKHGQRYITKYRMSDAAKRSSSLRISRNIGFSFQRRVVVIDKNGEMHFQSYSGDLITGINKWTFTPNTDEIFYLEFINERIIRYLSEEMFSNYRHIGEKQIKEAEIFWLDNMDLLSDYETLDEEEIETISSKESLIDFGLKKGYVYYRNIESLVEKGYRPMELLYELNNRGIIVNY